MSRSTNRKRRRNKRLPPRDSSAPTSRRERIAARKRKGTRGGKWLWFAGKRPVLRFVVLLSLLMGVFNACFYLWLAKSELFQAHLRFNARLGAAVLRFLGDDATAAGPSIVSSRFALVVAVGCDAIQASAFFVFAVVAFPSAVRFRARVPYLLVGTLLLSAMNLLRIISLYYTGVYFPNAFELLHIDVWQTLFVFVPLALWISWAYRTMPDQRENPHAAG